MPYAPDRGDVVWIDLSPQLGREQSKRRPALVLSRKLYNEKVGLCVVCPITSKKKGYSFEVEIITSKINGVVLSDQVKSLDWHERRTEYIDTSSAEVLREVSQKLSTLIF